MTKKSDIRECLKDRILILDGATGTMLRALGLSENEYRSDLFKDWKINLKDNNEILSLTNPTAVKALHKSYLEAGADIIETNTFCANSVSQRKYGLLDYVKDMNRASARLAKSAAKEYSTITKPRFVAGSIGPTDKSASTSPDKKHPEVKEITYDELYDSYKEQAAVLAEEDVDIFLVETVYDSQNAKAAINAIQSVLKEQNKDIPIMISVSISNTVGKIQSGESIEEFYNEIKYAKPLTYGLNCSLGVEDAVPFIENLANNIDCGVSLYTNAGVPNGKGIYPKTPENMASEYKQLAKDGCLNIAGGCCGTTPDHIRAIALAVKNYKPKR